MKKQAVFLSSILFSIGSLLYSAEDSLQQLNNTQTEIQQPSDSIQWYTSLERAKEANKDSSLPYYISFTGPDWCVWCQRLEKEIHNQPEFIQQTKNKFIFVQILIPKNPSEADPAIREFMLQQEVFGVPVILILSHDMKELGRLSYQRVSPKEFADTALKMAHSNNG